MFWVSCFEMWFSSVRHSLSTDYERNLFWHTMCAHRPTRSCILEVLIIVWLYQWNKINCIWLYNCYIELSTSLSTLWFRVSTLRAWLKAKGLPLLGELLADSVSVLEDWTDWTNRVAFVKSFHLANLLNDKRSSNLFLKKSSDMFFQSEVEVSVGRARQRKTWGFNGKHGLLRSQNQVCEPESSYVSFNGDPGHVPKVDRGLVCLLALSVGRAIMWKAQFDRKPDSKGATAVRFFVFVCRNCIVMHCLAVCFKGGSTDRPWGKPLIVSIAECWAWTRFLQFANMKCLAVWHVKDFFEGFCHLVSSCPFAAFFSRLVWSRKDSKSGWTQGALHGSEQEMSLFGEHLGISAKTIDPLVVSMYSVSTVWVQWTCLDILTV